MARDSILLAAIVKALIAKGVLQPDDIIAQIEPKTVERQALSNIVAIIDTQIAARLHDTD